jgi:hypothetical protein
MPEKQFFTKNTISFWEKIDMLGGKIGYKIDGQSTYKIHFGGLLTVILMGVYLYFLTMMLIPFLQRGVPRIAFQNYKDTDPPSFTLLDNIKVAFKINFPRAKPENNISFTDQFTFNATYITTNTSEISSVTLESNIKYEKSNVNKYNSLEDQFNKLKLKDSFTLVFDKNMNLKGSPISDVYSYFKIDFYLKNPSEERINQFIGLVHQYGCNLQVFYTDTSLELANYTTPYIKFLSYYEDDISYYETRKATIGLSLNSLNEQDGYLFYDHFVEPQQFLIHQATTMKFIPRSDPDPSKPTLLYSVTINYNKQRTDYTRSYMMIPELLSILGGNLYFLLYLFGVIYNYVNDYLFNIRLIEETFELDRDGLGQFEIIQPRIKKKISKFELVNLERLEEHSVTAGNAQNSNLSVTNNNATATHHSQNVSQDDFGDKKKKKKSNQVVPVIKKRRQQSEKSFFSPGDVCHHLFLFWMAPTQRSERKRSMYNKAKSQIDAYMDILSVTKRLIEIDLLKYLIFNEEQFQVCGMIGKPYISLDETRLDKNKFSHSYLDYADIRMKSNYDLMKMNTEQKKKISLCFEKISRKDKKSIIDKKLIDSVQDNIDLLK